MDFPHSLVLIIGIWLETNLRCYCYSSIRRKHMFFLWPQGMVPLCAEFSILQGWSEDIFNEAGKCYGFSCQTGVCSHKWRTSAALFCCGLSWPAFPSIRMLQRQGQEQPAKEWHGILHRRYPLTQVDLPSEMEENPAADHLDTSNATSPIFSGESIILSLSPSK